MAAKSNKSPAKKVAAKRVAKKTAAGKSVTPTAKVKAVEVEIVSAVPDLMPPEVVKQIKKVEDWVACFEYAKVSDVAQCIKVCATQATNYSKFALKAGASALVYAWACGKLLNATKARLGRGGFGQWRDEYLVPAVMSERTSQRYMQLAKQHDDVRALLEWSPSLRQAYVACGILPEPEPTVGEDEEETSPKTRALLTSLTGLQKNLRLFSGSGEKLKKPERTQLTLMRDELNQFFDELLG